MLVVHSAGWRGARNVWLSCREIRFVSIKRLGVSLRVAQASMPRHQAVPAIRHSIRLSNLELKIKNENRNAAQLRTVFLRFLCTDVENTLASVTDFFLREVPLAKNRLESLSTECLNNFLYPRGSAKSAAKNFLHCTKVLGLTTTYLARKFIAPSAQEFPANSTDREFVEVKFNHLPPPRADAREQSSN